MRSGRERPHRFVVDVDGALAAHDEEKVVALLALADDHVALADVDLERLREKLGLLVRREVRVEQHVGRAFGRAARGAPERCAARRGARADGA